MKKTLLALILVVFALNASAQFEKGTKYANLSLTGFDMSYQKDSRCQVRFDDSFSTVSRRHAAIIKDGDNWKLVQISKTNTTLLNGRPVQTEWYLPRLWSDV